MFKSGIDDNLVFQLLDPVLEVTNVVMCMAACPG